MSKIKVRLKVTPIDPNALSEHEEQVKVVSFCRNHPLLKNIFAVPNGGKRSMVSAIRAQAEGLTSGIPDLFLALPSNGYHGMFIEMKKLKGGVISITQKEWLARLNAAGYKAIVCKGHEEAIREIIFYCGG